jgi:AraC-like DNA-binding protein
VDDICDCRSIGNGGGAVHRKLSIDQGVVDEPGESIADGVMESPIYLWKELKPHEALKNFIDAYWISSTNNLYIPSPKKIFPDACTEIFANTGNNTLYLNDTIAIKPGRIYFGGILTTPINFSGVANGNFLGVRFKPGGFKTFFRVPLYEVKGQFVEMPSSQLDFVFHEKDEVAKKADLDSYFLRKLDAHAERFHLISNDLYLSNGNVRIEELSRKYDISFRSLERMFNEHAGMSAKELSTFIRFQAVLKRIRDKANKQSFLDLAFEYGYYDHSHLGNDIKKLTGFTPSQLRAYYNR